MNNFTNYHPSVKTYMRYLPWIVLGIMPFIATLTWERTYYREQAIFLRTYIPYIISLDFTIFAGVFWFIIHKIYDSKQATLVAFAATIGCLLCGLILPKLSMISILLRFLLCVLPSFLFGYLHFKDVKKASFLGLLTFFLTYGTQQQALGSEKISEFIGQLIHFRGGSFLTYHVYHDDKSYSSISVLPLICNVLFYMLYFCIFCEILHLFTHYPRRFVDKFVNLSNNYTSLQAFFLFISCRFLIVTSIISIFSGLSLYYRYPPEYSLLIKGILLSLGFLGGCGLLYSILWYYRKFLTEYFFSKKEVPSFLYWFMQIPIIGFFLFLYLLSQKTVSEKDKIDTINDALFNNKSQIILFTIIAFQVCAVILGSGGQNSVIQFLISLGLLLLVYWRSSVLLVYSLLISAGFIIAIFNPLVFSGLVIALMVYGIANIAILYLMCSIFHINSFEYIPEIVNNEAESQ